jgi:hypothetical protein
MTASAPNPKLKMIRLTPCSMQELRIQSKKVDEGLMGAKILGVVSPIADLSLVPEPPARMISGVCLRVFNMTIFSHSCFDLK